MAARSSRRTAARSCGIAATRTASTSCGRACRRDARCVAVTTSGGACRIGAMAPFQRVTALLLSVAAVPALLAQKPAAEPRAEGAFQPPKGWLELPADTD